MASHYKSHLGIRDCTFIRVDLLISLTEYSPFVVNCDFCSKKFSRRHDKQRHESSVHAEELQDNDD